MFELAALQKLRRIGLVRVNNLTDQAVYALTPRRATLERLHLSYCNQISVFAINFMLQKLPKLNHLSLTGIDAFRNPEFQQFCRQPPSVRTNRPCGFYLYSTLHRISTLLNGLRFAYSPGKVSPSSASISKRDIHLSSRPMARTIPITTTKTRMCQEWPLGQIYQITTTTLARRATPAVIILPRVPFPRPIPPFSTAIGLPTRVSPQDKPTARILYKLSSQREQTAIPALSCNRYKGGLADILHRHRGQYQDRQRYPPCIPTGPDHLLYAGLDNSL